MKCGVGSLPSPESQVKCFVEVGHLCQGSLDDATPHHPSPSLSWDVCVQSPPVTQPAHDGWTIKLKPGFPGPCSVPGWHLLHPVWICSGLQLLAGIGKENEVIYIIKTNCLMRVSAHCCGIVE